MGPLPEELAADQWSGGSPTSAGPRGLCSLSYHVVSSLFVSVHGSLVRPKQDHLGVLKNTAAQAPTQTDSIRNPGDGVWASVFLKNTSPGGSHVQQC